MKGPHARRLLELAEAGREHSPASLKPVKLAPAPKPTPAPTPPPVYCAVDLGEFRAPNGWIVQAHVITRVEG